MNFTVPQWLVNVWYACEDWGNVTYWRHPSRDLDLRRIDLVLVGCFAGCTASYGWLYGWQGAVQSGVMFVVILALALYLRR
jgi:hypothetical protein